MQPEAVRYLHLPPNSRLPDLNSSPFRAVVVVETEVSDDWQGQVSLWLVRQGCLYMMAWGIKCSEWDDSVDWANREVFGEQEIPDDKFVMTTWHDNELLSEAFFFAKCAAFHPDIALDATFIVHIATIGDEAGMLKAFHEACD